jgi:signal transduction histidine kinase
VILNILSNAAKYGSKKPIELRVLKVGDSIRVSCQDHGIGIPESKLEKIFERFERAIAASNISGLGLGLYIAKEIVVAHGGEIWAESAMGSGSCFNVNFPEMKDAEKEGVK